MEPRVFTRGNAGNPCLFFAFTSRFNGATRLHAWKRRSLRRKNAPASRFNGATRLHAWKRRHIGGGREQAASFNGATRLLASKQVARSPWMALRLKLQWSHASSRVETSEALRSRTRLRQ